jgi:Trypsin
MRRVPIVVVFAAALLAAVPAAPAGAIVGGAVDGNTHPYVGAMLAASGRPFCSGVLVATQSPDNHVRGKVFLTSAHCMGWAGNGHQVRITFGAKVSGSPTFIGTFHVMPGYVAKTFAHDVAVVVFSRPPAISPVNIDDGDTIPARGARVTTVGYGIPSLGVRKRATEIVTGSGPPWLDLTYGSGNSCIADSGEPDLIIPDRDDAAVPVVIALTDQGSCGVDQDYLVNSRAVNGFVNDPDFIPDAK